MVRNVVAYELLSLDGMAEEPWVVRPQEIDIANGGIVDADYGSGLSCRDPDNIALEFFAPAV